MYSRNGDTYFIVDGHCHFWDASPANWVKGQEQYAKGWIVCFHAHMGLGPAEAPASRRRRSTSCPSSTSPFSTARRRLERRLERGAHDFDGRGPLRPELE